MEEFEKELGDNSKPEKSSKKAADASDGEGDDDGEYDEVNEAPEDELGDNPFSQGAGGGGESEPWLGSDRDYTYEEVRSPCCFLIAT